MTKRLSTGNTELDEIMKGGFIPHQTYMISGGAGTGKTTIGWHFLTAGSPITKIASILR